MTVAHTHDIPRVDAYEKVRGALKYAADQVRPGMLYALLVPATIARGRITAIDVAAAERLPGVRLVLTHLNVGPLQDGGFVPSGNGYGFQSIQPLRTPEIRYRGQPIALVAADSLEAASEAIHLVTARYEEERPTSAIDQPGAEVLEQARVLPQPRWADKKAGDADAALARAQHRFSATYRCPTQHHNPIELICTVAEWEGDTLVIHEPTQASSPVRHGVAQVLGIDASRVRLISGSVGGGFGQKNSLQSQTALAAVAARRLGRPVKIVMPRSQLFHATAFRPMSIHKVQLGVDERGAISAAVHEIDQQTSRHDLLFSPGTEVTLQLYGIPNIRSHDRLVRTDVQTPGFMRAPFESPAAFAFESALDELAVQLQRDPVPLRLAHETSRDPLTGKPFSSRHLAACLVQGAERFGWSRRLPAPGSMRTADGSLVGWGMAVGSYKSSTAPTIARVRLLRTGLVEIGSIHASFVNEPDTRLNASGVKGLGEVAQVGVAPAIANAVFHATGKRVRHLPIRIEDVL